MRFSILTPALTLLVCLNCGVSFAKPSDRPAGTIYYVNDLRKQVAELDTQILTGEDKVRSLADKYAGAKTDLDKATTTAEDAGKALDKARADSRAADAALESAKMDLAKFDKAMRTDLQSKPVYLNAQHAAAEAQTRLSNLSDGIRKQLIASNPAYTDALKRVSPDSLTATDDELAAKSEIERIASAAFQADADWVAADKTNAAAKEALAQADAAINDAIAKDEKRNTLVKAVDAAQTACADCRTTLMTRQKASDQAVAARNKAQDACNSLKSQGQSVTTTLDNLKSKRADLLDRIAHYRPVKPR